MAGLVGRVDASRSRDNDCPTTRITPRPCHPGQGTTSVVPPIRGPVLSCRSNPLRFRLPIFPACGARPRAPRLVGRRSSRSRNSPNPKLNDRIDEQIDCDPPARLIDFTYMNQREAVISVMRNNGGFATLGYLYRHALEVQGVDWRTKTPFKSINRIVQDSKYFFRIRPGLWALIDMKAKLPEDLRNSVKPENTHSHYQGLIVELGNMSGKKTFVPNQDRSRTYLGQRLGSIITAPKLYPFTYEPIVRKASTVDVIWFDEQQLPSDFIEVENTTDMIGAFTKFSEFYGFYSTFRIVAHSSREREFTSKLRQRAFAPIATRTKFVSYETVSELHTKQSAILTLSQKWGGISE